jgi:hypothetical protein
MCTFSTNASTINCAQLHDLTVVVVEQNFFHFKAESVQKGFTCINQFQIQILCELKVALGKFYDRVDKYAFCAVSITQQVSVCATGRIKQLSENEIFCERLVMYYRAHLVPQQQKSIPTIDQFAG